MSNNKRILARIQTSSKGVSVIYHIGFLMVDSGSSVLRKKRESERRISDLAEAVYELYLLGHCALTQRKIGDNRYQYIATILSTEGQTERALRNKELYEAAHYQNGSVTSIRYHHRVD